MTWLLITLKTLNLKHSLKITWPLFIATFFLLAAWFLKTAEYHQLIVEKDSLIITPLEWLMGTGQLIGWYLRQFFVADQITLMRVIPVNHISQQMGLLTWLILAAITIALWLKRKNISHIVLWGWGWFLLSLLPIFIGVRFQPHEGLTMEPHWLYVGSIGLFAIAAEAISKIFLEKKLAAALIFISLITFYVATTQKINRIWQTPVSYCEHLSAINPEYQKGKFFLGRAYMQNNRLAEADLSFQQSLRNSPNDWKTYSNMAIIAKRQGNLEKAEHLFRRALIFFPDNPQVLQNLAALMIESGRITEGKQILEDVVQKNPWMLMTKINLAKIYEIENNPNRAKTILEDNLRLSPKHAPTIKQLKYLQSNVFNKESSHP